MNKKLLFAILMPMMVFALVNIFAGDRQVLIERYTSSTCVPCAQNNPTMDAFLTATDPDKVISIAYHMSWPAPGNDPMYLYNITDNNGRRTYYGVNSIPVAYMDGIILIESPYTQGFLQSSLNTRVAQMSPITVIVTDSTFGDSVMVRAKIYCETLLDNPNVTVMISVDEKEIQYSSPPGTNGETHFTDVMRKMLPSYSGTSLKLMPGGVYTVEQRYYKDPLWQPAQMMPLVIVQAQNKEILNAATKTKNFTLLPSPGYKVVYQGQAQSADFVVSSPVVASGYTQPVTLTASVVPPNSGIVVTFPSGNIINSFPGQVNMHVTSSSGVPTGNYRIVITGTNGAGKTHSSSVGLMVGKNYVTVGSNRLYPALQFKVDNVPYTSQQFFTWDLAASHTLSAVSPQTFSSIRYIYRSWSDAGDTTHTVNITPGTTDFTANYGVQYKLITSMQPSGIPATINGANQYFDSSSTMNLSISPLVTQYNGKTWYFQRWDGTGNGSYSGTNSSVQLTMNNVIVESAKWDTVEPFGITNLNTGVPKSYELHQNYPNPFNPVTKLRFDIPKSGHVSIVLYDVLGNEAARLVDENMSEGFYETEYNAEHLASGVYFYKLESGSFISVKKMILIK